MSVEGLNFVFIGDDAFALREDFLKLFELKREMQIFNYTDFLESEDREKCLLQNSKSFQSFPYNWWLKPETVEGSLRCFT